MFTYLLVAQGSAKCCFEVPTKKTKRREKDKEVLLGLLDLVVDFNWVVNSNPELFQECSNVIPGLFTGRARQSRTRR